MRFLDYLVKYWVLILAVFAVSSSVVVGGTKIDSLEDAVKAQSRQGEKIHEVQTNQAAIQEQLKAITNTLEKQSALQIQMLNKLLEN